MPDAATPVPADAAVDATAPGGTPPPEGRRTELRLALVCYGGVSLAVYMHGITKELHKLVIASRRFDEAEPGINGAAAFPEPGADTERVYFDVLGELADRGQRLSVTVDIIAGTSAGGINGVCLGKVIAGNGSQDALKRLWLEEGDLTRLRNAPRLGSWRLQAVTATLLTLFLPRLRRSPLRGDRMSRLLVGALRDMDTAITDRATLIPAGGSLELVVTTTDLHGYQVVVPTGFGGASQVQRSHSQLLRFDATPEGGDLGPEDTDALAFAARATSCFPGAFPPVSLSRFAQELRRSRRRGHRPGEAAWTNGIARRFQNQYDENGADQADAWFVDGGLLDNAPFDHVVKAIGDRAADSEVVRRIVYIQPDPDVPLDGGPATRRGHRGHRGHVSPPGWLSTLWQSVGSVRGSQPVLRELLTIRDMNTRIAAISAIAMSQSTAVEQAVQRAWEPDEQAEQTVWDLTDQASVQELSHRMHEQVRSRLGPAYPGYCLLKAEVAATRLAEEVAQACTYPPDSSRASFVRTAISAWARSQEAWTQVDLDQLLDFYRPIDIPYRERRLRFMLAGINDLYSSPDGPPRASLDALKREAWTMLSHLQKAPRAVVGQLHDNTTFFLRREALDDDVVLSDPAAFADSHHADFTALFDSYRAEMATKLGDGSGPLWQAFRILTADWTDKNRHALLSRYLGFPLWDALIFPTIALARLPQFTPIGVSQFSPLTAKALPPPPPTRRRWNRAPSSGAAAKLGGVSLRHFGAFTARPLRENDYLWGRLDGAELILRLLRQDGSSAAADQTTAATAADAIRIAGPHSLQAALTAIMNTEKDLRHIDPSTVTHIHQCITAIAPPQPCEPATAGSCRASRPSAK